MSSAGDIFCFRCHTAYEIRERIGLRDTCPKCDADLHCCCNCRHHNPGAHNKCNEPQAEWVREKDRSNYCDYFNPRRGGTGASGSVQDARVRFEDLFKK